ncbi:LacI family DNA-binding transcriptional regulator [Vagococcus sp. BWB3-3]|uniref:LacI family DNA-binding transcriptional regulator n=1 Tax=Vagococcus allomyrinae TaxID=2794353 RepID=A0A940SU83_9ENTE|nr:LacI family DNA-binding transcriptional regulator [Vagococcus allomyrinae]MBP1040484.1 LacI family DNA-binding transcriptional regulator [Vagococcus allomyrinae]
MSISMVEVAKRAGVSIATVSRVMNGKDGFSEKTRRKVEEVIAELGYQKNEMASSLKKNFSQSLGVIIPSVVTNYHGLIVEGIESKAQELGYSVLLSHSGENAEYFERSLQSLAERRVEGIIFVSIQPNAFQFDLLEKTGVAHIFISSESPTFDYPYIKIDDYQAAYDATTYLIQHGHQKIGIVGIDKKDAVAGIPRIKGYQQAMKDHQLGTKPDWVRNGDFGVEMGEVGANYLLTRYPDMTAIFGGSDEAAIGAIKACGKRGLRVPHDVSVSGFDDSMTALLSFPELTTIHQPLYQMGDLAVSEIINKCENASEITSQIVPYKLVERGSVAQKSK